MGKRTISVDGSGSVVAVPDLVNFDLAVETLAPSVAEAFERNGRVLDSVSAALLSAGVQPADLASAGRDIRAERRWENGNDAGLRGYVARGTLRVTVRSVADAPAVLQAGVVAGGDDARLERFALSVSDPQAAEAQARDLAWENAEAKAQQVAGAAGGGLGRVLSVNESVGYQTPRPKVARMMASSPVGDVHAGSEDVTVSLSVVWELV